MGVVLQAIGYIILGLAMAVLFFADLETIDPFRLGGVALLALAFLAVGYLADVAEQTRRLRDDLAKRRVDP